MNGRALRPVSFVLSRRMSNQEASSAAGRKECELENVTTCLQIVNFYNCFFSSKSRISLSTLTYMY